MAQYDLTQRMVPFLDRHLAIPLLDHLSGLEPPLFPAASLYAAQYELVKKTNMVDYAQTLFSSVHPGKEAPAEFASRRQDVSAKNEKLNEAAEQVLEVIGNPDVAGQLKQDKEQNMAWLKENYQLTQDNILSLYHFGQFQFTYGDYAGSSQYLYHFLVLSTDQDVNLSAHWGKLASDILTGSWDEALKQVGEIKDLVDSRSGSAFANTSRTAAEGSPSSAGAAGQGGDLAQLQARSWLLHWSLFVYFNHPDGLPALLDLFLSPAYLATIRTSCPHLLRYLVFAVIVTHRLPPSPRVPGQKKLDPLKEVVKAVEGEAYQYEDPLTQFVTRLHTEFDFEGAQESLSLAVKQVVANDFFLSTTEGSSELFLDNARYLVSETYCKIHQRVDINDLSQRLNLSREEGEKWIVNLIRDTRLEGKIDLNANMLHITRPFNPPSQAILAITRDLAESAQTMNWAMTQKSGGSNPRGNRSNNNNNNNSNGNNSSNSNANRPRKQEPVEVDSAPSVEVK
ncbi:eukaryotic translation initiation factor 3 subunit 6 [Phaffia rhodozyma]|uniref:Eukaryotic translation initiation factor 3 subunit E n=1 Tax=Phaffia rhodozyma TaxID=264483 RepID=A0A0F7SUJ9_PHARH|nr:eukaryotic translation initiation factor 3 subunit 6 [Phaffia rhodozyma]